MVLCLRSYHQTSALSAQTARQLESMKEDKGHQGMLFNQKGKKDDSILDALLSESR